MAISIARDDAGVVISQEIIEAETVKLPGTSSRLSAASRNGFTAVAQHAFLDCTGYQGLI